MKTDKEYPATHSMSTTWFAVDSEGNVAIVDFEDNGPVPNQVEETDEEEIICDMFSEDCPGEPFKKWNFTKEEIDFIMEGAKDYDYKEGEDYISSAIVKVDMSRFDEFKNAARSFEKYETICVDYERGLFYLDWHGYDESENIVISAIKSGIVTPLKLLNFWYDDRGPENLDRFPFFVYRQPYSPEILIERTVSPQKPFREDRLPDKTREKAIRLPFRFRDTKEFQIAEHELSRPYFGEDYLIDGHRYHLMPIPNGKEAYIALSSILYAGCGTSCRKCFQKGDKYHYCYEYQSGRYPTVAIIIDLEETWYRTQFGNKAVFLPILEGVPSPKSHLWERGERNLSNFGIDRMFANCHMNLEKNIDFFKPRVILVKANVIEYLSKYYSMEDGKITIGSEEYPYFVWEDREVHMEEIEGYSKMPYRGGIIPFVISAGSVNNPKVFKEETGW